MDFDSQVEDIDEVTKSLTVSIASELVAQEVRQAIDHVASTVALKGFRPGKAPREMVERLHGKKAREEVANRMMMSTLWEAVGKHELKLVGAPVVKSLEAEQGLTYTVEVAIFPQPKVTGYDSFRVELPEREITDEDVEQAVERVLDYQAKLEKLEFRVTAEAGDVVEIVFVSDVSEESGESGADERQSTHCLIDEELKPAELREALLGMEIGTSKEFEYSMPTTESDGTDTDASSQPIEKFTGRVTLQGLFSRELPELNDDFVKSLGEEGLETVLEFRMNLRERLDEGLKKERNEQCQMKVLDQLVDAHEFKIPQVMIDDEIRQMLQRLVPKLAESAEDFPVDSFRGDFEETATRRIKAGVIVDRVATAEDFKAEQSDIENWVQEMAQGDPAATSQIEKQLRESKDARAHVEEEIRRNKVLELLTSRTEIVYVADDGSDEDVEEATGKKSKPKAKSKEEGQS